MVRLQQAAAPVVMADWKNKNALGSPFLNHICDFWFLFCSVDPSPQPMKFLLYRAARKSLTRRRRRRRRRGRESVYRSVGRGGRAGEAIVGG